MKILDNASFACTFFALVLLLVSCGDDHTGGNHSGAGHQSDSHAPKSQDLLLDLLEGTDSPHGETSTHPPISDKNETTESTAHTAPSSPDDMEALLSGDTPVEGEPAPGAKSSDKGQLTRPLISATQTEATKGLYPVPDQDLEDLLTELSTSKLAFEEQINKLKKMVEQRDSTIKAFKLINQQLTDELSRLRKTSSGKSRDLPIDGEIHGLRDEILKMKNTFTLKVKELDELRNYNKQLVSRLDYIDPVAKRNIVSPLPTDVNTARGATIAAGKPMAWYDVTV